MTAASGQARSFLALLDDLDGKRPNAATAAVLLAHAAAHLRDVLAALDFAEAAEADDAPHAMDPQDAIWTAAGLQGRPATHAEAAAALAAGWCACGNPAELACARCLTKFGVTTPLCPAHARVHGDDVLCGSCDLVVRERPEPAADPGVPAAAQAYLADGSPNPYQTHSVTGLAEQSADPEPELPAAAVDGNLCGLANPAELHRICSAADGHPEPYHALHGARGRVVTFWPAAAAAAGAAGGDGDDRQHLRAVAEALAETAAGDGEPMPVGVAGLVAGSNGFVAPPLRMRIVGGEG